MLPTATVHDRYTAEEIENFYEAGFWEKRSLFDLVEAQAHERPDKVFVFDSTTSLTYRELHDEALGLALGLKRLGVRRGDRVAVQLPNWSELALISVALGRIGAVLVPIMPIYREDEVRFVL